MQADQVIEQLKNEYNSDNPYFELLSSWHNNGQFKRRTEPIMRRLRPFIGADAIALDAGCAAGAMAIELAKAGLGLVDAVDFSATALRYAQANAVCHGVADRVRFIESTIERLSHVKDNTYDLIVAADVIEHIVAPQVFIAEMWRVCRPGGVMLIETPNVLFRQHPWFPKIEAICRRLGLPESRNLFPSNPEHSWDRYHVSLFKWPDLAQLLREQRWTIIEQSGFGWWMEPGAADTLTRWISQIGSLFRPWLRYYADSDVIIIARKLEQDKLAGSLTEECHG